MKFFTKKGKAVKKWHSRAMVIDLSKTKVTFISRQELGSHVSSDVGEKGVYVSATWIEPSEE
jgi:hypothetical protein